MSMSTAVSYSHQRVNGETRACTRSFLVTCEFDAMFVSLMHPQFFVRCVDTRELFPLRSFRTSGHANTSLATLSTELGRLTVFFYATALCGWSRGIKYAPFRNISQVFLNLFSGIFKARAAAACSRHFALKPVRDSVVSGIDLLTY